MVKLFRRRVAEDDAAQTQALTRTRSSWLGRISGILQRGEITPETWEELEEILIGADTGVRTSMDILERVRAAAPRSTEELRERLQAELVTLLRSPDAEGKAHGRLWGPHAEDVADPAVVLLVGVNGAGKTTTAARLAYRYQQDGERVMAAAGDTFRAAAIEQLRAWGDRLGFGVIGRQTGADPAAVVFDAVEAARAREANVLLIDTAGRLHNKQNLMDELAKIRRVIERHLQREPDEVALVLDATTGQNGLAQARAFTELVQVTSVILTKLDGTAKGGIVFAVADELGLPVRFIGTGEQPEDLAPFDPEAFVASLLAPAEPGAET